MSGDIPKNEHMNQLLEQAHEATGASVVEVLLASIAADLEYLRAQVESIVAERGGGDEPWK